MNKNITLRQWAYNFKHGDYIGRSRDRQIEAGWYDWFCRDTSLAGKTAALGPKVLKIMKSPKVNPDTSYVFFKNNCPMWGSLYDDFRICDLKTGDVLYTITPRCGHKSSNGRAEVWGRENGFKEPLIVGKWKDVLTFFGI
jgi:hypothetical protein